MLSVVIPSYNEEKNIENTANVISGILENASIPYELIFVNDGSKDNTWEEICKAAGDHIRGVCFSRNFGKEPAIFAGLSEAKGECAVVIDCDLQHPPLTLVEMYKLWQEGYEVVEGVKSDRGEESKAHGLAAKAFYSIISKSVKIDMSRASDFKLMDRKALDALLAMPERNTFFRALSSWVGFKTTYVEYEVAERFEGETKWSTRSLIKYAIDNISSFSTVPMQLVTILGSIILVISIIFSIISLVQKIMGISTSGFTTVILLLGFIGSIIMISLGIIGYYIAKIYNEVKGRPRYIISKRV
ncbi:MAG: glycosyltransferase family 2 protein [Clostridiales bacterium]|nr:glycosyltransferase family 2 protein [Clostridiales bacterium]MBS5877455.1 glycosyltransferase family 2 protein [Clostridiales bacterium]MDU0938842.1 glycosyltransferase family 2 protein [Clostridiales bacterium]MDU1041518.1 glycosyltransferase family 2 protein [Clostridiales bacterium]MDU3489809.1 glycosyltransferase family 2 protein [Clostridiales bacterium]